MNEYARNLKLKWPPPCPLRGKGKVLKNKIVQADINSMIRQNGPGNLASNGKVIFHGTVWKRIIEYAYEVDNDGTLFETLVVWDMITQNSLHYMR